MITLVLQATEAAGTGFPGLVWIIAAFLLGALFTWLFVRPRSGAADETEREPPRPAAEQGDEQRKRLETRLKEARRTEKELRAHLQRVKAELQTLRYRAETAEANLAVGAAVIPEETDNQDGEPDFVEPLHAAPTALAYSDTGYDGLFASDNFQVIEGIGPRVNALLLASGYPDWKSLAGAGVSDLRRILQEAGNRYALSDPSDWPAQARLAAAGEWDALIEYQKSGKANEADRSDSKFEKLAAKELGFSSANPHDLKVVEGIGQKVEKVLKAAGIIDWETLASTTPEELSRILSGAGDRYRLADPESWPEQARYASAGRWRELRARQQGVRES